MLCTCRGEKERGRKNDGYKTFRAGRKRGEIKLSRKVKLLNMLEDVEGETDTIKYAPFDIITIGL